MTSVTIRPAVEGDAEAIVALIQAAFTPLIARVDPPPGALRETAATIGAELAAHRGLVAEIGGEVIGSALLKHQDDGLYLGRLAVAPAAQGRGVAKALLAEGERLARAAGYPAMILRVRLAMTENRRLFAGAGFVETALMHHDGYAEPTFAEMRKGLG